MWIRTIFAILLLGYIAPGGAASMRCGNKVVKTSDSQKAVQNRCGEPDKRASGHKMIRLNGLLSRQRVDQWTYYQGRGKHMKIILFYKGRLVDVTLGERTK